MKEFNITGTCYPDRHYMVDISARLQAIGTMIDKGQYFCINRGRQYGKTTTLNALRSYLSDHYSIFSLSFEDLGEMPFISVERLCAVFLWLLNTEYENNRVKGISPEVGDLLSRHATPEFDNLPAFVFSNIISKIVRCNARPIVVFIDEVDKATRNESFVNFLGILRKGFLNRTDTPFFQSVILAGVYDIRNLKLKIRTDDKHQSNSPWNIATPFELQMELPTEGIAGMLDEYQRDHHTTMDTHAIAQLITDYCGGYPFFVSRLCMLMHQTGDWSKQGFLEAVKVLLNERNTLFDDLNKKLEEFPDLANLMRFLLFQGDKAPFNSDIRCQEIALMFGWVRLKEGSLVIANRLFETRLYNRFLSEDLLNNMLYREGNMSLK